MALLFMDSFDSYVTADLNEKWTTIGGSINPVINSGTGRRSGNSLRLPKTAASAPTFYVQKVLVPIDITTFIIGFAVVVPANLIGTAGIPLAAIKDGGTTQMTLRLNADFTLTVLRGVHSGTVLATSSGAPLSAGVYAYIEWKVLIHPSAGTVDVRVNNTSVTGLSLTSQNTRASATSQWTSVLLGIFDNVAATGTSNTGNIDYDDFYVLDGSGSAPWNTFLGDCRVDVRNPTGAGTTTGWTPSTGSNWQNVDDAAPNDDTDYNSAAAINLTDTFVTQDAPVAGATIYGVQHCIQAKKMDAGVGTIAPVIRHSGVDNVGSSISLGTTYSYGIQMNQVNPGTGLAWVESDFNNAEFGYKRIS